MLCGRRSLSPSAEETAAKERVRLAREQGLTLACGLTFCQLRRCTGAGVVPVWGGCDDLSDPLLSVR